MCKVRLVIIDDSFVSHNKINAWWEAGTTDFWSSLCKCDKLISNDTRSQQEQIVAFYKTIAQVTAFAGPTIVILDCSLLTGGYEIEKFREELKQTYTSLAQIPSNQVEGVALGVAMAQTNTIDPLMIIIATSLGTGTVIRNILNAAAAGHANFKTLSCEAVAGADSLQNVDDMNWCMDRLVKQWDEWRNEPFYAASDCCIRSLLKLYDDCWNNTQDNEWDNAHIAISEAAMQFAHDCFNSNTHNHVKNTSTWLFDESKVITFDDNSLKTLFIADRVAGRPARYASNNRPIKSSYLSAALKKLNIDSTLQEDQEDWYLPVIPGVAFLVSLKAFIDSIQSDHTDEKCRPAPTAINWTQEGENDQLTLSIEIDLVNFDEQASNKLLNGGGGGAKTLQHLLRAHTDGVSATKPWSPLFRIRGEEAKVANASHKNGKLVIEWGIRRESTANA